MKLGLFNLMTQRDASITPRQIVEDTLAMVKLADEIGFDIAWFAEHHFSNYSICPSPLMMAAYHGNPLSVKTLLELGADFSLRSKGGNTALTAASLPGNPERMLARLTDISKRPPSPDFDPAVGNDGARGRHR